MSQTFALQLGLKIRKTNVGAQKINSTTQKTYGMIVSTLSILDQDDRKRIFKKSILLANVIPDLVFGMLFLIISNVDIDFQAQNL